MRNPNKRISFAAALTLLVLGSIQNANAQSDAYLRPVDNQPYKEACGACHFVYQPGLLPSGSWSGILGNLPDHFGESLDIAEDTKTIIAGYLTENAAEHSTAKRSFKIMESLGGQAPSRITDIPYIRRKHDDISPDVFTRKTIGSPANCSACHTTAEQGIYDDDNVEIPK